MLSQGAPTCDRPDAAERAGYPLGMELGPARCAVHTNEDAALACLRCGAFACTVCSPSPSVLCVDCASRGVRRGTAPWSEVPPVPGRLVRLVLYPTATLYAACAFAMLVRWLLPHGVAPALVILAIGVVVLSLALARLGTLLRGRRGRLALRAALAQMREQHYADAAVRLEETLRSEHLDTQARALGLYLFSANVASVGLLDRSLHVLEPLTRSGWRDIGTTRLLRGQGLLVLAVVHALRGDLERARIARAQARFGFVSRVTYTPAYGDAVIAARAGEHERALVELKAAHRFARRWSILAVTRSAAVIEAFVLERIGRGDGEIETALAPARASPRGAHDGTGAQWPEMADFLRRRLPSEDLGTARLFGAGDGGSPLTPESAVR